jgi:hypothetical protein
MKKVHMSFQIKPYFGFMLVIMVVFQSCKDKTNSNCGDPVPTVIQIGLVDANDSLLIGGTYNPDSIHLMVQDSNINISIDKGWMSLYYDGLEIYNNVNFLLYLSTEDVDTLTFKVTKYPSDCFVFSYEFGGMTYNSKTISHEANNTYVYKIIKE